MGLIPKQWRISECRIARMTVAYGAWLWTLVVVAIAVAADHQQWQQLMLLLALNVITARAMHYSGISRFSLLRISASNINGFLIGNNDYESFNFPSNINELYLNNFLRS